MSIANGHDVDVAARIDAHLERFAPATTAMACDDVALARELLGDGRVRDAVTALTDAADMHVEAGCIDGAIDALDIAAHSCDDEDRARLAEARALVLANVEPDRARTLWQDAARLHAGVGDRSGVARSHYCAAWDLTGPGLVAELERVVSIDDDGWSHRAQARLHLLVGANDDAIAADERALRVARARADRHLEALSLAGLGVSYSNCDRHADAVVALRRAIRLAGAVRNDRWLVLSWINLTEVLAEAMRLAESLAECERLVEHVDRHELRSWTGIVAMHEALQLFRAGRVADAARRSGVAFEAVAGADADPLAVAMVLLHARILVELGVEEGIDELLAEAHAGAAAYGFESFAFEARALDVRLALVRGDVDAARVSLAATAGIDEPVPVAMLALAAARASVHHDAPALRSAAVRLADSIDRDGGPAAQLAAREVAAIDAAEDDPDAAGRMLRHCARGWRSAGFELEALRAEVCAALVTAVGGAVDPAVLATCEHRLRDLGATADASQVHDLLVRRGDATDDYLSLASLLGIPADQPGATRRLPTRQLASGDELQLDVDAVHIVVSGRMLLVGGVDDRVITLGVVGAGELLGDSPFAPRCDRASLAVAETDVMLASLPARQLVGALHAAPEVAVRMLSNVVQRARQAEALAERLAAWTLQRRLAAVLVELADTYGTPTLSGGTVLSRAFSQQYLASRTAVSREAIARAMGVWRESGFVEMRGRRIVLSEPDAIRRVAAGSRFDELASA